jgi:hypothetical protein
VRDEREKKVGDEVWNCDGAHACALPGVPRGCEEAKATNITENPCVITFEVVGGWVFTERTMKMGFQLYLS